MIIKMEQQLRTKNNTYGSPQTRKKLAFGLFKKTNLAFFPFSQTN